MTLQARHLTEAIPASRICRLDMLAGTAEFRLEQVAEIVQAQGEIVLVRFHQSPPKRLIPPLPRTGVVARPAIAAAA